MGFFGGCYQSGDFQDEENSYLNRLILENEQEKLVPKEMTLNDLLFYPMENSNKNTTLFVLFLTLFIGNNYFGMNLSVSVLILYSIHLMRKYLKIKEVWRSNAYLLLFLIYSFITNVTSSFILAVFVYLFHLGSYLFIIILPLMAFINIVLTSGIIITFAIGENRIIWTYIKFFKELFGYNILSLGFLLATFSIFICIFAAEHFIFVYGVPMFIKLGTISFYYLISAYIIITTVVCWSKFLYKFIYPDMIPEKFD